MPLFSAFDPSSRLILFSGTTAIPSELPYSVFEGIALDGYAYRVTADGSSWELKPALDAIVDPLTVAPGGTVTVQTPVPVSCWVDGVYVGNIETFSDTIQFTDPGEYRIELRVISQLRLNESFTVTVA